MKMNFTAPPLSDEDDIFNLFDRVFCELKMKCSPVDEWDNCSIRFPDLYKQIIWEKEGSGTVSMGSKVTLVLAYTFITLMSLVGNSLVIVTFIFDKHMRSVTNVFILSLAVADIMVTLTCVPINIGSAFASFWIFGPFACKLVPFFMTFSVACSSLTLCSIALDRYFAIVHPHRFKFLRNPMPAGISLVVIWGVSFLCSVPNAVFYTARSLGPLCIDQSHVEEKERVVCIWPDNPYKLPLELWLTLIVLFIIPLIIMSTTYGLIGYQLWIRKPVGSRRNSLRNADMKKSVIKMLVIVMLAFIMCWSPIMVLNAVEKMVKTINLTKKNVVYLKLYFQCLSMASCCINPIIYTFMNRKFREKFVTYLCCRKNLVGVMHELSMDTTRTHAGTHTKSGQRMSMGVIVPRSC